MEEIKKQSVYEEPELQIIHLTEQDIITTSGDPFEENPAEGEFAPYNG